MEKKTYLVVPTKVQALQVKSANINEIAKIGWNMDSLKNNPIGEKVEPEPFASCNTLYNNGIYLHWIVPDAFTKGKVVGDNAINESIEEDRSIIFPNLCDKFKIYRVCKNSEKGIEGEIKLIDPIGVVKQKEMQEITAVFDGDPAYCANYQQCMDYLGSYDDLKDLSLPENFYGELCYIVVGFYSSDAKDLLYSYDSESKLSEFLCEFDLKLSEDDMEKKPNRIMWFGECRINIVEGKIQCDCKIPQEDKEEINFAIGNNAMDALASLIAVKLKLPDAQREKTRRDVLRILYEIESNNSYENFDYLTDSEIHTRGFLGVDRGYLLEKSSEDMTQNDEKILKELNEKQEELNRKKAELETIQEEAYLFWQKVAKQSYTVTFNPSVVERNAYNGIADAYKEIAETYTKDNDEICGSLENYMSGMGGLEEKTKKISEEFWLPKDPCLLIEGERLKLKFLHGFDSLEVENDVDNLSFNTCQVLQIDSNKELDKLMSEDLSAMEADFSSKYNFEWKEPWNPLFIDWKVSYKPEEGELNKKWELGEIDFKINDTSDHNSNSSEIITLSGKSVANPFLTELTSKLLVDFCKRINNKQNYLQKKIERIKKSDENLGAYIFKEHNADLDFMDQMYKVTNELIGKLKRWELLAMPLSGFNDQLMGKKPKMLQDYQKSKINNIENFDVKMSMVYKNKSDYLQKENFKHFYVTRQGKAWLKIIRIIDGFGRKKEYNADKGEIILTCSEEYSEDYKASESEKAEFWLRPRVIIPSRIQVKVTDEDTPVFGWIVPNYVDNSIYVYNSVGNALGYIYSNGKKVLYREFPAEIENDYTACESELKNWIYGIADDENANNSEGKDGKEFYDLLEYLYSLDDYRVQNGNSFMDSSIVFESKILALVKVKVDYEIKGLEPQSIIETIESAKEKAGEKVERLNKQRLYKKINLILGNDDYLNEGLMLFYTSADGSDIIDYSGYKKVWNEKGIDSEGKSSRENMIELETYGEGSYVTLLMDPQKETVVTSGILPAVRFSVSPPYVENMMKKIHYCMEIGTFFSTMDIDEDNKMVINIPLPTSDNTEWSFKRPYREETEEGEIYKYEDLMVSNLLQSKDREIGKYMVVEGCLEAIKKENKS